MIKKITILVAAYLLCASGNACADLSYPMVEFSDGIVVSTNEDIIPGDSKPKKYHLFWMFDGNSKTAWVFENSRNKKPEITFMLPKEKYVDRLGLVNGYSKSKELYFANNRIKKLLIKYGDGSKQEVSLADSLDLQYIKLQNKQTGRIEMSIEEVSVGAKHNDTCISELVLELSNNSILASSFIATDGGEYPRYYLSLLNRETVFFPQDDIVKTFFIENGKYAFLVGSPEMGGTGILIYNLENGKKKQILSNLNFIPYSIKWLNGHVIGDYGVDGKTQHFEKKVNLP